ncbi:MAG: hypothetical protein VX346_06830 [Planctomycetota bacterium]|nr:hypothetical protein [Planctomycetota bacterium]
MAFRSVPTNSWQWAINRTIVVGFRAPVNLQELYLVDVCQVTEADSTEWKETSLPPLGD